MHSILLVPLVARCIETREVCIWRNFVCSDCVGVCGNDVPLYYVVFPRIWWNSYIYYGFLMYCVL